MGQSSSRLEGPQTSTANNLQSDTVNRDGDLSASGEGEASTSAEATSSPIRSRRTSMRQSLRALVKPSESSRDAARNRVDSTLSNPDSQLSRKRSLWRSSRRWSKAPAEDMNTTAVEEEDSPPVILEDNLGDEVNVAVTSSTSKGKEREEEEQTPSELAKPVDDHKIAIPPSFEPPSPIAERQEEPSASTSTNIGTWLSGSGSLRQTLGLAPDEDEVVISPTTFADDTPAPEIANPETNHHHHDPWARMVESNPSLPSLDQSSVSDAPSPPPAQNQNQGRQQFPPAGTLVIVQALVHTADIPRRRFGLFNRDRDAASRPSTPRPASYSPSNSGSATRQATPVSRSLTPIGRADSASATRSPNRLSSFISRPSSGILSRPPSFISNPVGATPAPVLPAMEDAPARSDASPNTASETSTSGDQTPDLDHAESNTSVSEDAPAPSQTLSASSIDVLGTLLSVAAAATAASLLTGASGSLLRRGTQPPSSPDPLSPGANFSPPPPTTTDRPTSPTPTAGLSGLGDSLRASLERFGLQHQNQHMDSRERMRNAWGNLRDRLSRRAAADDPRTDAPTPPSPAAADPAPTDSPTDLRERMLVDMARAFQLGSGTNPPSDDPAPAEEQASTTPSSPSTSTAQDQERSEPAEGSFERFLVDLQNDLRVALSSEDFLSGRSQDPSADNENDGLEPDSGINSDGNPTMSENPHVPDTRTQNQGPESIPNTTSGVEHRHGGNVNWWRSYQFPQVVTTPHTHAPVGPLHTTNSGSSPMFTPQPSHPQSTPSPAPSTLPTQPPAFSIPQQATSAEDPSSTENNPNPNVVIPAIVVGLYTMNNRRRASIFGGNQLGADRDDSDLVDDENDDGLLGGDSFAGASAGRRPDTPRGRSWHSRAANAFRNLRPGRRRREAANEGSRSFMIYVIGGYYPPDHSLITGALDSFEALWELAEMLGQVKPQTVSKDEIEKSGLEICKPAALEQYEKDGRVASNCLERCLICLDDYDAEDDLRLLSCKHAFHKICVDQWLQTGKNNCPACRTKGVSTGDESEEAAPAVT